jgi:hypothetical protein
MSIRPGQSQSQAAKQEASAGDGKYFSKDSNDGKASVPSFRSGLAHKVQIDNNRNLNLSNEIAVKSDSAATSTALEIHECEAEQVSAVLARLRRLASQSNSDDGLSTPDLLATADEYRGLRSDLAAITERLVMHKQSGVTDRVKLSEGLERELTSLRNKLGMAVSTVPNLESVAGNEQAASRPNSKLPLLGRLDSTIEKVGEYHSYLQQIRNAVDTQLMKPLGASQELRKDEIHQRVRRQLQESQMQILNKGAESLLSSKATDPKLALRLLDPTD